MIEKILRQIEEVLKYSFIIGSIGALIVYLMNMALIRRRKGVWEYNLLIMVIIILSGGFFSYLVGTFINDKITVLGINISRDFLLGVVGASSFSLYSMLESRGFLFIEKLFDKFINKL